MVITQTTVKRESETELANGPMELSWSLMGNGWTAVETRQNGIIYRIVFSREELAEIVKTAAQTTQTERTDP